MAENGVVRAASNFENDFREFNGRPPTAEETKRHLAFDRLAKTSSLDPATVLLIVDAERNGSTDKALTAIAQHLDRIERRVDEMAKRQPATIAARSPADGPFAGILPYFLAFCGGAVVVEALFFALGNAWLPAANGLSLFVLGLSATAAILWLAPLYVAWRDRRW